MYLLNVLLRTKKKQQKETYTLIAKFRMRNVQRKEQNAQYNSTSNFINNKMNCFPPPTLSFSLYHAPRSSIPSFACTSFCISFVRARRLSIENECEFLLLEWFTCVPIEFSIFKFVMSAAVVIAVSLGFGRSVCWPANRLNKTDIDGIKDRQ